MEKFFKKHNFYNWEAEKNLSKLNAASKNIEHYCRETYYLVLKREQIMIDYMKEKRNINLITNFEYLN